MKKLYLSLIAATAITHFSIAQNTAWPGPSDNSNVGIGTTTPTEKLTLRDPNIPFDASSG